MILLTGCRAEKTDLDATGNREETNDINLLDKYLKDNSYSFNSKDTEALESLKVYKEDFDNSSVIFLGENHNVNKNYELRLYFIKYLVKEYGELVFIGEFGYSTGLQLNEYLETGDIEILNNVFSHGKGTAAYNKEHYDFWIELYNYINTLDNNVIEIVGIDIEHQMRGAVEYLQHLLTNNLNVEHLKIFDFVFKIDQFIDLNINYNSSEYHIIFDNVINEYRSYLELDSEEYKNILGDNYLDVKMIIKGLVDAYDAYYLTKRDGLSFAEFSTVREEAIYQNFLHIHNVYNDILYFGQWGAPHTDLYCNNAAGFGNTASMATFINNNPEFNNKLYTINLYYTNINLRDGVDDIRLTAEAIRLIKDDYTILKLNGEDTVFKQLNNEQVDCTRGFVIDYPDNVGVLDHFQSVIVINNAGKTANLDINNR